MSVGQRDDVCRIKEERIYYLPLLLELNFNWCSAGAYCSIGYGKVLGVPRANVDEEYKDNDA